MLNSSQITQQHPQPQPFLYKLLDQQPFKRCLVQVPLQFQFEPLQILTKQLTKFNANSEYRVLYLGPRWSHNHQVHKQLSHSPTSPQVLHPQQFALQKLQKYKININPKQRTYIMKVGNHNSFQKNTFYYRAFEGPNPTIKEEEDLRFDSHFESGNLDCAIKVNQSEYDLFIRIDSNTRGHTLWYYFSITCKEKQRVTLNISNVLKHTNLYKKNMKPYVFSCLKFRNKGIGWEQAGENVVLEQKEMRYQFVYEKVGVRKLSQLKFEYQFEYKNDKVFFAYCVPYTYSLLMHQIQSLVEKTQKLNILQVQSLGTSLLGVKIPLLKITDSSIPMHEKKIVLVTGRIHPGQSCGSLMTEGLLQHLCSSQGLQLRRQAVFIIIPMMNPDGVILGNYRTGVSGVDLNRVFQKLNKQIYPQVFHLKMLVKRLCLIQPIYLYLDFHGHSSKKNAFSYGPAYKISDTEYYKAKLLPKLTSLKTPMFRYYSCIFRIAEGKKDTARSVFFYQYNIPFTYTIQASNGSFYEQQTKQTIDFNKQKWRQVGMSFVPAIQQFIDLLQIAQRKEFVQTAGGMSRRRFGSPNKRSTNNDSIGIFQQSLELVPKKEIKNQYQYLIDQIKNDQRKHRKQDSDDQISSDDDNVEDALPKTKLSKLSKLIVQNCNVVQNNYDLKMIRESEDGYHLEKKVEMDNIYGRKYQMLNKSRKIRADKNDLEKKQLVNNICQTNIIIRKKSQNQMQSALMSQRATQQTHHDKNNKRQYNWKITTTNSSFKKSHNKRNVSAVLTYRNNVPKVQMSLDVDEPAPVNLHRDQQQLKRLLELTQGKSRNRARSLSQTEKRKKKAREQVQSFLYPQVFQFNQFIEENNKMLLKLNKKEEPRKVRYNQNQKSLTHGDHPKVSCPSAFYKIKQSLNNRRRDDSLTTLEKGVIILNNRKK